MRFVQLRHPVTGGVTEVAESAVPVHESRGWVVDDQEPGQGNTSDDEPLDSPPQDTPDAGPVDPTQDPS